MADDKGRKKRNSEIVPELVKDEFRISGFKKRMKLSADGCQILLKEVPVAGVFFCGDKRMADYFIKGEPGLFRKRI